jgi:hypothetical protein
MCKVEERIFILNLYKSKLKYKYWVELKSKCKHVKIPQSYQLIVLFWNNHTKTRAITR